MSSVRRACIAALACFAVLSASVSSAAAQGMQLLRDAETETYVREIMEPIFRAAGLDPKAVHIYLVGDPTMNAFVAGGQNIFIHTGLITAAELPNELIGVLAHETGHITGGHISRTSEAMGGIVKPMLLGMAIGIGALIAGAPEAGSAILSGSQHVAERAALSYSRTQEASADQAAIGFLEATHQSGKGLLTFFDRLRDLEIMSARNLDPYVLTHPLSSERVTTLTERVERSPYYGVTDSPELVARHRLIAAKIHGFLDRQDVALRRYPVSDQSAPARYARSVIYFRQGNVDDAVREIDTLIAEQPSNPYFLELKGQILFESGRVAASVAPYADAVKAAPQEPLLRTGYGQALLASAETQSDPAGVDRAILELRNALLAEPDSPIAWRYLARAYSTKGDVGMAELSTAELYFNSGNLMEAAQFAVRARGKLKQGSVAFNRANDIVHLAQNSIEDDGRYR